MATQTEISRRSAQDSEHAAMPLSGHLQEVHRRLLRIILAFLAAAVVGYLLSDRVLDVLRSPIQHIANTTNAAINYDSISGAFDLKLKITVYLAVMLSIPVWLLETLAFTAPALKAKEKRYVFGFLGAVFPLFLAGCMTGVSVFPQMVKLLTSFAAPEDTTLLQASYYFDFVIKLVFAVGIAFTLPALIVLLNFVGLLPAATIAQTWKAWVMAITIFSALVTPAADLISMFLIAIPMSGLFGAALLVTWLHDRKFTRKDT